MPYDDVTGAYEGKDSYNYPEIWCGPKCGNWPAKTADECTFCKRRNIPSPQVEARNA